MRTITPLTSVAFKFKLYCDYYCEERSKRTKEHIFVSIKTLLFVMFINIKETIQGDAYFAAAQFTWPVKEGQNKPALSMSCQTTIIIID